MGELSHPMPHAPLQVITFPGYLMEAAGQHAGQPWTLPSGPGPRAHVWLCWEQTPPSTAPEWEVLQVTGFYLCSETQAPPPQVQLRVPPGWQSYCWSEAQRPRAYPARPQVGKGFPRTKDHWCEDRHSLGSGLHKASLPPAGLQTGRCLLGVREPCASWARPGAAASKSGTLACQPRIGLDPILPFQAVNHGPHSKLDYQDQLQHSSNFVKSTRKLPCGFTFRTFDEKKLKSVYRLASFSTGSSRGQ